MNIKVAGRIAAILIAFLLTDTGWGGERGPCSTPERAVDQFILGIKRGDPKVGSTCLGPVDWSAPFLPIDESFTPVPYRLQYKITVKRPAPRLGIGLGPGGAAGSVQRGDVQILIDWKEVVRRGAKPYHATGAFLLRRMEDGRWIILDVGFEPE